MTTRRTRGSKPAGLSLQNDCNEPAAPRIVTPLAGDNGGDLFSQSPQSQYVTPLASGRSPSLATPSPSSTCVQYAAEADEALQASLAWKATSKSDHPLANFLDSRGKGQPKGWFRLAVFGKAGGQLKSQEKQYIVAQYVALSHLNPDRGSMGHLASAWGVSNITLRRQAIAGVPSLSTEPNSSFSRSVAVVEEEEVYYPRTVDSGELDSMMSSRSFNEQQLVGLQLGQNETIEVQLSVLKSHFEAQLDGPILEQFNAEISRKEPGQQLIDLVKRATEALEDASGVATLSYDSNGRSDKKVYAHVPQSRGGEVKPDTQKKRAKTLETILKMMSVTLKGQRSILEQLAKSFGMVLVEKNLRRISPLEALAFQQFAGLSGNGTGRVDKFLRFAKDINIFPPQLLKTLASAEKAFMIQPAVFQMELQVGKEKTQSCVWWHLKDPIAIMERLISSAINDNKFQESSKFSSSNVQEVIYIAYGCDRGGESTTMLVRVLNQEDGNSAAYSQPICQYEDGAECYSNLAATIYSETFPMKKILQDLVDDEYHAITVKVVSSDGTKTEARTEIVKLQQRAPEHQQYLLTRYPGDFLQQSADEPMPEWIERIDRNVLNLTQLVDNEAGEDVSLAIRIVTSNVDAELPGSTLVGFCLYEEEVEKARIAFCLPLQLAENSSLSFEWHPVIGLPSQDTKQSLIVSGQGTASVKKPCLGCDLIKKDFEYPPTWFHDIDPVNFPMADCKDGELRTGDKANHIAYANWLISTDEGGRKLSTAKDMEYKTLCDSVTAKPLLNTPHAKEPYSPMHALQGCASHFFQECRDALRAIDGENSAWMVDRIYPTLEAVRAAKEPTEAYTSDHKAATQYQSAIERYNKKIAKEREKENPDHEQIFALKSDLRTAETLKKAVIDNGYRTTTQLRAGLADFEKSILDYIKKECKSPRGEAGFTFNNATTTIGGVSFRPEHSGLELAHRDNIKVLSAFDRIFQCVCTVYPDDNSKRQKVVELMEQAKAIAAPLRTLCILLKSQERIRPNQQLIIKTNLCRLWLAWRKNGFPHGLVFNKLHHVVAHVIRFIKKFEMYGRVSEEGFEAAHPKIESTKAKTKSMISNQQRIAVECRRTQILMNPRISEINKALHPEPTRRGSYNKQYRTRAQDDTAIGSRIQHDAPVGYFKTKFGCLLKFEWLDVHEMCQHKHAPGSWTRAIDNYENLGSAAREKARYSKH